MTYRRILNCILSVFQALLWDMVKLQRLGKLEGHYHDVCSCDFSPDGALLATASYDTRVIIWDPHTRHRLVQLACVPLYIAFIDLHLRTLWAFKCAVQTPLHTKNKAVCER